MQYVLVASETDVASMTMYAAFLKLGRFTRSGDSFQGHPIYSYQNTTLIMSKEKEILLDRLDDYFAPQSFVFLSKHRSESGLPTLTAHFTGNFSDDISLGGYGKEIAWTDPLLLKAYLTRLWAQREKAPKYDVILEGTHHGPTSLNRPCLFVEIGSTDQEWEDSGVADLVVRMVMDALSEKQIAKKVGIGIGGPHYSRKFTELILNDEFSLAGYIPKHSLIHTDDSIIRQVVEKCIVQVNYAFVDWKGLGTEKRRIVDLLQNHGLQIEKI